MKAKQQWLKTRTKSAIKRVRGTWEREPETSVRIGWQRYTTYYRKDSINWLRETADSKGVFLMDLIEDIINDYKSRH